MRYSEADRILHLYTLGRGRVSAIAKGVRKTKSRFGARLEPLSPDGLAGIEGLLSTPLADAWAAPISDRARREALAVVTTSYEEHGGFRLRTLSA